MVEETGLSKFSRAFVDVEIYFHQMLSGARSKIGEGYLHW